jgi:hypothetical protein
VYIGSWHCEFKLFWRPSCRTSYCRSDCLNILDLLLRYLFIWSILRFSYVRANAAAIWPKLIVDRNQPHLKKHRCWGHYQQ